MLRPNAEIEARGKDFGSGLLLEIVRTMPALKDGQLLAITSDTGSVADQILLWAQLTGHSLVERARLRDGATRFVIRKGQVASETDDGRSQTRFWIYSNFHCNLACDYCCVSSSPSARSRIISVEKMRTLASEAAGLGFQRIFVTGGEPFMRDDIANAVKACVEVLPTTVLTNAMLFHGKRLEALRSLPRDRVTLQVSLDSPTPELHDSHRGEGSWQKAFDGIKLARSLGFRVRVAATCSTQEERNAMEQFLAHQGLPPEDRLVRPIARLGEAADSYEGMAIARADVVPEITVTAEGLYWHPVGATTEDFRLSHGIIMLETAMEQIRRRLEDDRKTSEHLARVFHCA